MSTVLVTFKCCRHSVLHGLSTVKHVGQARVLLRREDLRGGLSSFYIGSRVVSLNDCKKVWPGAT